MQVLFRSLTLAVAATVALLGLSACSLAQKSSPSRFYVLSAELPQGQAPLFEPGQAQAPSVVLSAVRVVTFLDRPQVTIRRTGNAVSFDEFVRWAEPLSDGVTRVLRSNFVELLGTPESALPWVRNANQDFNLFVFVDDVQLQEDGQLELRLSFRINDTRSSKIIFAGERTYVSALPLADTSNELYAAVVETLSKQLGEFSLDVAKEATALKQRQDTLPPAQAHSGQQAKQN